MGFPMSIMWGRLCNRYVTSNASISERQKLVFAPRTYAELSERQKLVFALRTYAI